MSGSDDDLPSSGGPASTAPGRAEGPAPPGVSARLRVGDRALALLLAVALVAGVRHYVHATREARLVTEAVNSLHGLLAWEERRLEAVGARAFSADPSDRIGFAVARWDVCTEAFRGGVLQEAAATRPYHTPDGCQFEYAVLADRCDAGCSLDGADAPCEGTGACLCAVAVPAEHRMVPDFTDRFCADDDGTRRTTRATPPRAGWLTSGAPR